MSKVIITAAVNGNRMDTDGTFIPVAPEEIGYQKWLPVSGSE